MITNDSNPFETPSSTVEDVPNDVSRPSPMSALSLLSTMLVFGFITTFLVVAWRSDITSTPPSQWADYFIWMEVGLIQAMVLGLWMGAGPGHIAVRTVLGALLLYGQSWEMSRILSDELTTYVTLVVATLAAGANTFLLAICVQRTVKQVAESSLTIFLPAVLCCSYLYLTEHDLWAYYAFTVRSFGAPETFIPLVLGIAALGIASGLLPLVRKHRLSWPWYVGCVVILLVTPLLVDDMVMPFPMINSFVAELAVLILITAVNRMLRSYGEKRIAFGTNNKEVSLSSSH